MMTGIAVRLLALHAQIQNKYLSADDREDLCRACWSIIILSRSFSPCSPLDKTYIPIEYPASADWPGAPSDPQSSIEAMDLFRTEDVAKDVGVSAYQIELMLVWSDIASYLRDVQKSRTDCPWKQDSRHMELCSKLYEYESKRSQKHLLRNVFHSQRSAEELLRDSEYWIPWISMQILFHTAPAILNHPFIHIVNTRQSPRAPISRQFLQQTIDLALFNSRWVACILQICDNFPFDLLDPLLGSLIAAVATVHWIFQFAKDQKTSACARQDFETCLRFLSRMSNTWPFIQHKVCLSSFKYTLTNQMP